MGRQRLCLMRLRVQQHHDAFGRGGAALAGEDALAQAEGTAPDGEDTCADVDSARVIELAAEIELEPDDGEFSVRPTQVELLVIKEADAAAFTESGEDSVVDMSLPVAIAIAQRIRCPNGIGSAQRGQGGGSGFVVVEHGDGLAEKGVRFLTCRGWP